MIRIALPNAKNSVPTMTNPATGRGCDRRSTAASIAPSVDREITANITQWPARSGPSTLPASTAPASTAAATTAISSASPARLRQLSQGRASSASTANHATAGTATR